MALINCIECGHIVSDKAFSCPNCGYPMQETKKSENIPRKPRKKHKKLPNGYGSIKKLSGNRNKPYAAYPPTTQFKLNGSPVTQPAIGYYEDWYSAFDALREYNKNPYDLLNNDITFKELFDLYFKSKYEDNKKRTFSVSSKNAAKTAFKNCLPLHNRKFKELRKIELQAVVDDCPLKHSSLELIVTLLNQMYKYAMENDIVDKNYAQFVTINIPDDDESGEPFSQEELDILWKNKDMKYVNVILIMIYSGFRIKAYESIEINLDDCYFKGGIKTKAGKNRIVPIHPAILKYAVDFNPQKFNSHYFREKCFYRVLKTLGISITSNGKKHTPHDCRHTFSWLCDKYGVDDFSKHLLMGHSFGSDIEKSVYGHRTIEELKAEMNKIKVLNCC